jgi:hypothetical protein
MTSEDMSMRYLFGASYIAYEFCKEYGIAMEDGLSTASKLIEEKEIGEVDCINAEEAEIILRSVLAAARRAIEHIDQEKLRSKAIMQDQEKVPFTHHSEIIMLATSLDRRLHPVAKAVIEKVLGMYSEVIEESKKEALLNLNRRMYASLEKAIGIIVANVHKNCETFRPDSDDLERYYRPFLPRTKAAESQSSIEGQSSRHPSVQNRSESPLSSSASSSSTLIRKPSVRNLMETAKTPVDKDMQNNDYSMDSEKEEYFCSNSVSASREGEDKGVRKHRKSKVAAINKYFSNFRKNCEPLVFQKPTAASKAKYKESVRHLLDEGLTVSSKIWFC